MAKKAKKTKKAKSKKAVKKAKGKDERNEIKSQYGHLLNKQSGFIDVHVALGMSIPKIEEKWNKVHPGVPMKPGRVKCHLKHLVEKHGFSKTTTQQLLAANKVVKKNKS